MESKYHISDIDGLAKKCNPAKTGVCGLGQDISKHMTADEAVEFNARIAQADSPTVATMKKQYSEKTFAKRLVARDMRNESAIVENMEALIAIAKLKTRTDSTMKHSIFRQKRNRTGVSSQKGITWKRNTEMLNPAPMTGWRTSNSRISHFLNFNPR